jgi:hypothetical protein
MWSRAIWSITAAPTSWPVSIIWSHRYRLGVMGIVTNPPHKLAVKFACKALDEVPVFGAALAEHQEETHAFSDVPLEKFVKKIG